MEENLKNADAQSRTLQTQLQAFESRDAARDRNIESRLLALEQAINDVKSNTPTQAQQPQQMSTTQQFGMYSPLSQPAPTGTGGPNTAPLINAAGSAVNPILQGISGAPSGRPPNVHGLNTAQPTQTPPPQPAPQPAPHQPTHGGGGEDDHDDSGWGPPGAPGGSAPGGGGRGGGPPRRDSEQADPTMLSDILQQQTPGQHTLIYLSGTQHSGQFHTKQSTGVQTHRSMATTRRLDWHDSTREHLLGANRGYGRILFELERTKEPITMAYLYATPALQI